MLRSYDQHIAVDITDSNIVTSFHQGTSTSPIAAFAPWSDGGARGFVTAVTSIVELRVARIQAERLIGYGSCSGGVPIPVG